MRCNVLLRLDLITELNCNLITKNILEQNHMENALCKWVTITITSRSTNDKTIGN